MGLALLILFCVLWFGFQNFLWIVVLVNENIARVDLAWEDRSLHGRMKIVWMLFELWKGGGGMGGEDRLQIREMMRARNGKGKLVDE